MVGCALGFVLCGMTVARAEVTLGQINFDTLSGMWNSDWNAAGDAQSSNEWGAAGESGNSTKWLRIRYPGDVGPPPGDEWDVNYVAASTLYAGDWTTNQFVRFDFYASNEVPAEVKLWWSDTDTGDEWMYDVDVNSLGWTRQLTVPMEYGAGWVGDDVFLDRGDYVTGLSSIDWIGIYIKQVPTGSEQIFGLENVKLMIPEPSQWWMLASAAMGIILSRRRRG